MKFPTQQLPAGKQLSSGLALALCLWLAGCAGAFLENGNAKPPFRDPTMTMENARERVVPGQSTKADVTAALGQATVVRFDSGFEVWVYRDYASGSPARASSAQGGAEFVILFAPSGVVKKTRIRPPAASPR